MKAKLDECSVNIIKDYWSRRLKTQTEMAIEFNVSRATISKLLNGLSYKSLDIELGQSISYICRVCKKKSYKNASTRYKHEFVCGKTKDIKRTEILSKDILSIFEFEKEPVYNNFKKILNKQFRYISLKLHPDKGGNTEAFQKLLEQKNKLLEKDFDVKDFNLLIDDWKTYRSYVQHNLMCEKQNHDRNKLSSDINEVKKKLNETRAKIGTSNEYYKELRKSLYRLNKSFEELLVMKNYIFYKHHFNKQTFMF